jgi:uncharacterized protein (DUF1697 family)
MATYIALLRAINVAGSKPVAMANLRSLFGALGLANTRTLLQTGNVVFEAKMSAAKLESLLEAEAKKRLKLETDFFVRAASDLQSLIKNNPYPTEAARDPGHLVVQFLKGAASQMAVKSLQAAIAGPECITANGKHLYVVYPSGIGRSKLTNKLIESKLATRATGRNWNTVLKLAALADN